MAARTEDEKQNSNVTVYSLCLRFLYTTTLMRLIRNKNETCKTITNVIKLYTNTTTTITNLP